MTDRQPGKYQNSLHSKPWFFSGKVPEIKYSYTIAGLTPSPYPIRPRSIIPGKKVELQPVKSGFFNVDEEEKKQVRQKEFKESNFLKENEVLLTIEHCDNCEEHSGTTRHDPLKYYQLAQTIKNAVLSRYPMVKILIKPVSKLDPESNKKRMGAFEVQVSNKSKGKLTIVVLHSKLSTRKWPDVNEVVTKLSSYLPTCQLFVTVFDENNQDKPLKGLKVSIKPKPIDIDIPRPNSHYSTFRPKSAITTRSLKSIRGISGRRISHKTLEQKKNSIIYERTTDRDGTCLFENIPLDIYEIEVLETKEFKSSLKIFNTFEERLQNSSLNVYMAVKSRENSTITVILRDNLIKEEISNAKVMLIKNAEMYSLKEIRKGAYEINVPKGDYQLSIITGKYNDVLKNINANDIEIIINENLELKKNKEICVVTCNAVTGESLSGVLVNLIINNSSKFDGLTKIGKYSFKTEETGLFSVKSRLKGFIKSKISLVIGGNDTTNIYIGLVPLGIENPVLLISWCKCSDDIEVQSISSKPLSIQSPEIEGYRLNDKLKSHGFASIDVLNATQDLRLSIKSLTSQISSFNGFLYSGITVQFYSWGKLVCCIRPSQGTGEWWDVGLYSAKYNDFIETNIIVNYSIGLTDLISDYYAIIKLVQESESVSNAFQFSSSIVKNMSYGKDSFLSPEIFKKSIQNIVNPDALAAIISFLGTSDGISLNAVTHRYQRYVGARKNPIKTLEAFISEIGMDSEDETFYRHIAQEGFYAQFPSNWEITYETNGDILYKNTDGETTKEFPNIQIYKKKFLDQKKQDFKASTPKVLEAQKLVGKKEEVKRSRPSSGSSFSSKSSKSKKNSEKIPNKKETKKTPDQELVDEDTGMTFLNQVNEQCEKLAELAVKSIQFYSENHQIDKEVHQEILKKIEEYLENFEKYLSEDPGQEAKEFFKFWSLKFTELKEALQNILDELQVTITKQSAAESDKESVSGDYQSDI